MALISYLITMFAGLFWLIRVIFALMTSLNLEPAFAPADLTTEIVILFVTLFCLILIIRRHLLGAILYFVTYAWYFGKDLINVVMLIQQGGQIAPTEMLNVFMAFVGIILALATVVDIGINKNRKGSTKDKKTDWFYRNKTFDREFDERADRNNYKF